MDDGTATAATRLLVLAGVAGVLTRFLMRSRHPRVYARSSLQVAPAVAWLAVALLAWHPVSLDTPGVYDAIARPVGVAAMAFGGAFSAWAAVHMGRYWDVTISALSDHRVVDDGPFGVVRHPIYLGVISFLVGGPLAIADPVAALFCLGAVLVFLSRARAEERFLEERLGEAYLAYARRVPMLLPRLRR
jgi:protein-S-isoprenylcysteine O-methyltransferase Ste14